MTPRDGFHLQPLSPAHTWPAPDWTSADIHSCLLQSTMFSSTGGTGRDAPGDRQTLLLSWKVTNPFCLRASTRQARVLTVATTLPPCAGHRGGPCALRAVSLTAPRALGGSRHPSTLHRLVTLSGRCTAERWRSAASCDITMFFIRHASSPTLWRNMLTEIHGWYFGSKAEKK